MMQVLSQLLSAALGSVGFGLIFNLNRRYLPAAAVGGFLAWLAASDVYKRQGFWRGWPTCWPIMR